MHDAWEDLLEDDDHADMHHHDHHSHHHHNVPMLQTGIDVLAPFSPRGLLSPTRTHVAAVSLGAAAMDEFHTNPDPAYHLWSSVLRSPVALQARVPPPVPQDFVLDGPEVQPARSEEENPRPPGMLPLSSLFRFHQVQAPPGMNAALLAADPPPGMVSVSKPAPSKRKRAASSTKPRRKPRSKASSLKKPQRRRRIIVGKEITAEKKALAKWGIGHPAMLRVKRPRKRAAARDVASLPEHLRWTCPYDGCSKTYNRKSATSIRKHERACIHRNEE